MDVLRLMQRRTLHQLSSTRPGQLRFRQLQQTSQQPFRTRPLRFSTSTIRAAPRPSSSPSSSPFFTRSFRRSFQRTTRRFESTTSTPPTENLSLAQRLKKLSKDYGWSALGVYLALTALDFPFCFLAVRALGTDRIGYWEHVAVSWFKDLVTWPVLGEPEIKEQVEDATREVEKVVKAPLEEVRDGQRRILEQEDTYVVTDHGYKEAEKANSGANASLWTQLALAYAIHKSFIFIRVPLTAAITPKVVKTLRGWGWNISPKMPKRRGSLGSGSGGASGGSGSKSGVNTKGSGVKPDD